MDNKFFQIVELFKIDNLIEAKKLIEEIYMSMTNNPAYCLKMIMKYSGLNKMDFIDIMEISERTYETYLYSSMPSYNKKTLIRLILKLNLPPIISKHLLNISGCSLNLGNENEGWIYFIIENCWKRSIEENIKYLNKTHKTPATRLLFFYNLRNSNLKVY